VTRKDFELIAGVVLDATLSDYDKRLLAVSFAGRLRSTNPNFNRERFITACTEAKQ